jgi:hypothetical protein
MGAMTENQDDEIEVNLLDMEVPADAECTEFVGVFADFEVFARLAVETLVHEDGLWLLECLDWARVKTAMEIDGLYRFRLTDGNLFRDTLRRGGEGCAG